jgi:hypothetical protein
MKLKPSQQQQQQEINNDHSPTSTSTLTTTTTTSNKIVEGLKILASLSFLFSSIYTTYNYNQNYNNISTSFLSQFTRKDSYLNYNRNTNNNEHDDGGGGRRRRLMERKMDSSSTSSIPSYMRELMKELKDRKQLFDDTPPEEVKYWFEYTGPLKVSTVQCSAVRNSFSFI